MKEDIETIRQCVFRLKGIASLIQYKSANFDENTDTEELNFCVGLALIDPLEEILDAIDNLETRRFKGAPPKTGKEKPAADDRDSK